MSSHRKVDGVTRLRFFVCETEWASCTNKTKYSKLIRKITISNLFIKIAVGIAVRKLIPAHEVGLFACQICFVGAAPRNEHPPQSIHKDCVSLRIVDIFYEALCVEMSIIKAQGLPESPHHVLGNLWIKIAG